MFKALLLALAFFITNTAAAPITIEVPGCAAPSLGDLGGGKYTVQCGSTTPTPTPVPVPPPVETKISCPGYASTTVVNVPWISTTLNGGRIETVRYGQFPANGVLILKFTVPVGFAGTAGLTLGEYRSLPVWRQAFLSETPCDFTTKSWFVDRWEGTNLYPTIQVGGTPRPSTAQMQPGKTYYLNVRNNNRDGSSSCSYASCDMQIEFAIR